MAVSASTRPGVALGNPDGEPAIGSPLRGGQTPSRSLHLVLKLPTQLARDKQFCIGARDALGDSTAGEPTRRGRRAKETGPESSTIMAQAEATTGAGPGRRGNRPSRARKASLLSEHTRNLQNLDPTSSAVKDLEFHLRYVGQETPGGNESSSQVGEGPARLYALFGSPREGGHGECDMPGSGTPGEAPLGTIA